MADVKSRRVYSSPLRARQAETTRRAVLHAARELFTERGYAATSIDEIARRAGVSKPTVFNAVGTKQGVLRTLRDVALAGDDEPVPVVRRPATERIRAEPDLRRAVDLLAGRLTEVAGRYALIHEVLHAAAAGGEPELREVWETEQRERLTGARFWVAELTTKGPLAAGLDRRSAQDLMWLLMAPDHFHRLVHQRRWSPRRYQRWLAASLLGLFDASGPRSRPVPA